MKRHILCLIAAIALSSATGTVARGQAMNVGFEDISLLMPDGWTFTNNSNPLGETNWFQGEVPPFSAQSGSATSYAAANFCNTGGPVCAAGFGTISNWMILPTRTLSSGDTLSFWTRSSATQFYDRLQVRMSLSGASGDVGATETSVGNFTALLLDINPTYSAAGYPTAAWTQFNLVLSGIPAATSGRLAFRYFIEDGGFHGVNGSSIGIDSLVYNPFPEPSSIALVLTGAVLLICRRR
ncbi:MAG: choice-of-anchor J domain-containing protein [Planctomycetota bacterium]